MNPKFLILGEQTRELILLGEADDEGIANELAERAIKEVRVGVAFVVPCTGVFRASNYSYDFTPKPPEVTPSTGAALNPHAGPQPVHPDMAAKDAPAPLNIAEERKFVVGGEAGYRPAAEGHPNGIDPQDGTQARAMEQNPNGDDPRAQGAQDRDTASTGAQARPSAKAAAQTVDDKKKDGADKS